MKHLTKSYLVNPTESLRKDHALIEKMINALKIMSTLLQKGTTIPKPILDQTIDFSTNFTNQCHHGKEEESLFPTLEKNGMPKEGGPIARMLFEHEITKNLTNSIIKSTEVYLSTGQPRALIEDIEKYVGHVSLHLSKENQRLFVMADMLLADKQEALSNDLTNIEQSKLNSINKTRRYYEDLVENVTISENKL
jgi:hemerythrin-like domain-containing protein